ncbi:MULTISPECIES: DUF6884 domain-containing protein [unclassified Streptomyces]|uniref:DUF6884 domain-containing protein n=1 Tax=unclassified Streptomyces TaxID=2593676 RepID=UPI00131A6E32|nr:MULTISPECIES: DUF6884 domain-containing protein [unclassified Streptomyces]MYX19637.1 hypothetical protein [Streptomyces sp. SID8380]
MLTTRITRTRITIDRDLAEAVVVFDRAAGKGRARAAAARRLAVIYRVSARHPYRTLHYNPAGSEAPAPTPDELRLEVSGDPERVARYLSAVPRYLARVEALSTKAARVYGRWVRGADGENALQYVDSRGARAYARRFRADAFAAIADCFGISSLPRYVDPTAPMWEQAARIAWDVVKAEGPVSLYAMHDGAEAEELLAAADRTPDPAVGAYEREFAELCAADARRSARLFAALDGEELPADEAPVEEATAEDVVEDQEDEELSAVELTPVQRRWLHTAAAHPEGFLPTAVNHRTARSLGAAGLIRWTHPQGRTVPVAEAVWKLDAGEVRITAAGRRRAAAEERERVVIVACGGRKAVYADGVRKGEPVIGERAGALYVGSYHRAMRRAADVLTQGGRTGRVLILSAKYGLVELDRHLLNYNLRVGDPGTVDGETLRRQAHELGISGAAVTVLGGRAYTELAEEVWDEFTAPLAGTRGIGEQLARLVAIYDPARAAVEAASENVVERREDGVPPSLRFSSAARPSSTAPSSGALAVSPSHTARDEPLRFACLQGPSRSSRCRIRHSLNLGAARRVPYRQLRYWTRGPCTRGGSGAWAVLEPPRDRKVHVERGSKGYAKGGPVHAPDKKPGRGGGAGGGQPGHLRDDAGRSPIAHAVPVAEQCGG